MFAGHYAAALAAKTVEPRAPLWTYALACQLIDVGWSGLIMAGVERAHTDDSLQGSKLVLEHMPWTHSLPGALVWSVAAALLAIVVLRLPRRAGIIIGLVVFSHWLLDLLVHRPDLELWFGGPKVGLGWWNYAVPEQALEIGLVAVAGATWAWTRGRQGQGPWSAPLFIGLLIAVQLIAMVTPPSGGPLQMGGMALAVYLLITVAAGFADRRGGSSPSPATA